MQRVDRRYQNPKPGKLKRVKWPRKLVDVLDVNLQVGTCRFRLQSVEASDKSKALKPPASPFLSATQWSNQNHASGMFATQRWNPNAVSQQSCLWEQQDSIWFAAA